MRSLLIAAAVFGLAASTSAQTTFGLKGGLNVANFGGDDAANSEARLGVVAGAFARVPFTPLLALQVEGLYSQKGEEYLNTAGFTESTRLDYLEVPATLRLSVPASPALDLGVSAGGYLGVPLNGQVEVDGIVEDDLDLNTDYGFVVGADLGSGPFTIDARYSQGLTEAIDFDPALGSNLDKKNQVVSLTFGYRFGGGGYGRY